MQTIDNAPRITVRISVGGEPWGTCNFRSWQEIIDYFQPYADSEAGEKMKDVTNKHDKEALTLLRSFSEDINRMIECMDGGDAYTPSAIGGILNIGNLMSIRDKLVMARMKDDETEAKELEKDNNEEELLLGLFRH